MMMMVLAAMETRHRRSSMLMRNGRVVAVARLANRGAAVAPPFRPLRGAPVPWPRIILPPSSRPAMVRLQRPRRSPPGPGYLCGRLWTRFRKVGSRARSIHSCSSRPQLLPQLPLNSSCRSKEKRSVSRCTEHTFFSARNCFLFLSIFSDKRSQTFFRKKEKKYHPPNRQPQKKAGSYEIGF